jgi:hypothetical protein
MSFRYSLPCWHLHELYCHFGIHYHVGIYTSYIVILVLTTMLAFIFYELNCHFGTHYHVDILRYTVHSIEPCHPVPESLCHVNTILTHFFAKYSFQQCTKYVLEYTHTMCTFFFPFTTHLSKIDSNSHLQEQWCLFVRYQLMKGNRKQVAVSHHF